MRKTDKIYAYPAHGKEMIQCASKPKSKEMEIKEDEDYTLPNNSNYITKRKSIKFDFRIPKRKKQNEFELKFLEVKPFQTKNIWHAPMHIRSTTDTHLRSMTDTHFRSMTDTHFRSKNGKV